MKLTFRLPGNQTYAVAGGRDFLPETTVGDIEDALTADDASPAKALAREIDFALTVLRRTDEGVTREHIRSMRRGELRKLVTDLFSAPAELARAAMTGKEPIQPPEE